MSQANPLPGILRNPRKDGDAVPAFPTMPDGLITRTFNGGDRKLLMRRLELLQADDVRFRLPQPAEQNGKTTVVPFTLQLAIFIFMGRDGGAGSGRREAPCSISHSAYPGAVHGWKTSSWQGFQHVLGPRCVMF